MCPITIETLGDTTLAGDRIPRESEELTTLMAHSLITTINIVTCQSGTEGQWQHQTVLTWEDITELDIGNINPEISLQIEWQWSRPKHQYDAFLGEEKEAAETINKQMMCCHDYEQVTLTKERIERQRKTNLMRQKRI